MCAFGLTEHHTCPFLCNLWIQKAFKSSLLMIYYDPPLQIIFVCQSRINNLNFIKYLTRRIILKDHVKSTFDSDEPSKNNYLIESLFNKKLFCKISVKLLSTFGWW